MKKILASLVAIAMFASIAAVFTGCGADELTGKIYAIGPDIYTVITELAEEDADGNRAIKTKIDLTEVEIKKIRFVWEILAKTDKSLADAKAYTFTAEEQKNFDEYLEMTTQTYENKAIFKDGKYNMTFGDVADPFDHSYSFNNTYGTYEIEDDKLYIKTANSFSNESKNHSEYGEVTYRVAIYTIGEDVLTQTEYGPGIDSKTVDFTGKVFSSSNMYAVYCTTHTLELVK